jgi:hypothetical protein
MICTYITSQKCVKYQFAKTDDLHAIFGGFSSDLRAAKQRDESAPT